MDNAILIAHLKRRIEECRQGISCGASGYPESRMNALVEIFELIAADEAKLRENRKENIKQIQNEIANTVAEAQKKTEMGFCYDCINVGKDEDEFPCKNCNMDNNHKHFKKKVM